MSTAKGQNVSTGAVSPCEQIQNQITSKTTNLNNWQSKLDFLLGDTNSDLGEIQTLRGVVEDLNRDLLRLKADKRKLGCPSDTASVILQDSQTVISTSSVRRKDFRTLEIVPTPATTSQSSQHTSQ